MIFSGHLEDNYCNTMDMASGSDSYCLDVGLMTGAEAALNVEDDYELLPISICEQDVTLWEAMASDHSVGQVMWGHGHLLKGLQVQVQVYSH